MVTGIQNQTVLELTSWGRRHHHRTGQDANRAESGGEGGTEGLQWAGRLGFLEATSVLGLKGGGGARLGDRKGMTLWAEVSAQTKLQRQYAERTLEREIGVARDRNGRLGAWHDKLRVFHSLLSTLRAFQGSEYHVLGASQKGFSRYVQGWGTNACRGQGAGDKSEKDSGGHSSAALEISRTGP